MSTSPPLARLSDAELFAGKRWLSSPEPYPLSVAHVGALEKLGHRLLNFQLAANRAYHQSKSGKLPAWIAQLLDQGKPADLLSASNQRSLRNVIPRIIRPDVLVTGPEANDFSITEIDSVPGGIGLTGWLGARYHEENPNWNIVGGPRGMLTGFASLYPKGADILVSQESADYLPEMRWLADQLGPHFQVKSAENYQPQQRDLYRFFELFDHAQIQHLSAMQEKAALGELSLQAPLCPWLEEKSWLALLWNRSLRNYWRQALRENHYQALLKCVPQSWILDPEPLPAHAVYPGLEIQSWSEMASFSQNERRLVAKISGFSELAWGSRSVTMGHDVPQAEWMQTIQKHLNQFPQSPAILQRFIAPALIKHPYFDPSSGAVLEMEGRVRLCPYFFVNETYDAVKLGGVLATIVPADKKIVHGMEAAILAPCREVAYQK